MCLKPCGTRDADSNKVLGLRQQHWQIGQSMPPKHASLRSQKNCKTCNSGVSWKQECCSHNPYIPENMLATAWGRRIQLTCLLCLASNLAHSSTTLPALLLIWIPCLIRISTCINQSHSKSLTVSDCNTAACFPPSCFPSCSALENKLGSFTCV